MKMDKVAGSGNDEFYTPYYAIEPILPYLRKESTILCPFDTEDSFFVKVLRKEGHKVVCTHIGDGIDFFELDKPKDIDYIISNPPYSVKTEVLDKLFQWGIPFAMLVGVVGIFESKKRFNMFKYNKFEVMYMDKRVGYMKDFDSGKCALSPPFSSVYICSNVLKENVVFAEINKKQVLIPQELF